MEYYSGLKRNEVSSDRKTWRNLKCILLIQKGYYMTFWKTQNYGHSKKISGCQGWVGVAQSMFRAVKILCMIP